ncbi:MAG: phosphotransferase [Planctomycetes bacterium]|nr:phosphotransferase [Planctomycetota bacterium]
MLVSSLDESARVVLEHFASLHRPQLIEALGNRGGFSGARLWRGEGTLGPSCLRAWPTDGPSPERLAWLHRLMATARRAGLSFVPDVFPTRSGATWIDHAGRRWELTSWLPGRADFQDGPTPARLRAACTALARLHTAWERVGLEHGPCPAVARRLLAVQGWQDLVRSGWRPHWSQAGANPVDPWAERAWRLLSAWSDGIPRLLEPWRQHLLPLQPCLCDIWHDHLLFEGDQLTGLVDYGAVKVDHVAVDLARMLGSLVGDDRDRWDAGLRAYRQVRSLSNEEEALAVVLDRTGTLLGAANWLRWIYHDGRTFEDKEGVVRRLAVLVERMERWIATLAQEQRRVGSRSKSPP